MVSVENRREDSCGVDMNTGDEAGEGANMMEDSE